MTNIRFDHFLSYTSADNIDNYLKEYAALGFVPYERTVRHDPGLRNGFVSFNPEYIEFLWVEDEALFEKGDSINKLLRKELRPFGIGMITDDVQALHNDWISRGYSLPEVWSKAPRDAASDASPVWSYQEIPDELLPGASCWALTYLSRPKGETKQVKISPNTIYAVSGVIFVTHEAQLRAEQWRDLLAPDQQLVHTDISFDVRIGPHQVRWMTPDTYRATFNLKWLPSNHSYGEIALLHLLASYLPTVKRMMENSGRRVSSVDLEGEEGLLIESDPRDGYTFLVREQQADVWLEERIAETGEKLVLE